MEEKDRVIESKILCNPCNTIIVVHEKDGKRVPCPNCGSTARHFFDYIGEK